jgi:molybdopterin/thiamine biosynthesis adenylyltransferase
MGYTNVSSMSGGYTAWKDAGLPFVVPRTLNSDQMHRYSRHVLMPEVGEEGQLKLLDAKVLLVGAGGLGSPSALYLAAAGVGTLGIVDSDVVDESNLQRQVLHATDRVGMSKVESAKLTIGALNPEVNVVGYETRLTPENARDIVAGYDVVVDGVDNFDTRYLLNDLCVELGKPNVSASILSFDGQITTFVPDQGPCYRCVYPEPPPPALAPT